MSTSSHTTGKDSTKLKAPGVASSERSQLSLTYEQLQKIIERVLINSGYYNVNQAALPAPNQYQRGKTAGTVKRTPSAK